MDGSTPRRYRVTVVMRGRRRGAVVRGERVADTVCALVTRAHDAVCYAAPVDPPRLLTPAEPPLVAWQGTGPAQERPRHS